MVSPDLPLSKLLLQICDLELSLGNEINPSSIPEIMEMFPMQIRFRMPLHREELESALDIPPSVEWRRSTEGVYFDNETGHAIRGPLPEDEDLVAEIRQNLSPDLLPLAELELSLGNTITRVDQPAGSTCPYAVNFKDRLHRKDIEQAMEQSADISLHIRRWESRDPHYEVQGGYTTDVLRHCIAGPL
jgi:hypothetical protein